MPEIPIATTHVYWYSPEDPSLPDLIGQANATAAGLLHEQGKIGQIFSSARVLERNKPPLSETIAKQVKVSFPDIPESALAIGGQRASTTFGEIRDLRNYLVQNDKVGVPIADVAAKLHQRQMEPFYHHFFPGQKPEYFNFEDVLRASPIPEHRELIAEVEASLDYQKMNVYLAKFGLVYWMCKNCPFVNEVLEWGPVPYWKVYLQKLVIGKS